MSKVILKVQAQMDMFELNAEDAHTFASNAEPKMQISLQGKQRVPARCMRGWFWSIFSIHLLMLQMMVAKEIKMVNDECGFSPQSRQHEMSLQTI